MHRLVYFLANLGMGSLTDRSSFSPERVLNLSGTCDPSSRGSYDDHQMATLTEKSSSLVAWLWREPWLLDSSATL